MATILRIGGGTADLTKIYSVNIAPNSSDAKVRYTADADYDSLLIVHALMNDSTHGNSNIMDGSATNGTLTLLANQYYEYGASRLTHNVYRWDNVKSGDTFTATSWWAGNMTVLKIV